MPQKVDCGLELTLAAAIDSLTRAPDPNPCGQETANRPILQTAGYSPEPISFIAWRVDIDSPPHVSNLYPTQCGPEAKARHALPKAHCSLDLTLNAITNPLPPVGLVHSQRSPHTTANKGLAGVRTVCTIKQPRVIQQFRTYGLVITAQQPAAPAISEQHHSPLACTPNPNPCGQEDARTWSQQTACRSREPIVMTAHCIESLLKHSAGGRCRYITPRSEQGEVDAPKARMRTQAKSAQPDACQTFGYSGHQGTYRPGKSSLGGNGPKKALPEDTVHQSQV